VNRNGNPEIDWDEDSRPRYKEETAYYTLALKIQG